MKRLRTFVVFLLIVHIGSVAYADGPSPQAGGHPYVVQPGDTLAKLADRFYGDPQVWPAIQQATNAQASTDSSFTYIANPHLIEVGQKLWIPGVTDESPAPAAQAPSTQDTTLSGLQQAYQEAIRDAEIAEPDEISRDLIAIVDYNPYLRWKGPSGERRVRVVTWTSYEGYDNQIGQFTTLPAQVWVTVVPELQGFCTSYEATPADLTLRLEQLLGLSPEGGKTRFVEMWVDPQDLFRPSPDPEITDHEAELDFPVSSQYVLVSDDYQTWFNELKSQSYGDDGYPWTRLGYTYDWGNPDSEVGLSEFVIGIGATVDVHSVSKIAAYCGK
jgi:hypothetical protein